MSANYTLDPNMVAYYMFEHLAFDQSGTGTNHVDDDAGSYPTEDSTNYKRGAQSASFTRASSQRLQCAYANLTANFPGVAAGSFTAMAWVRFPSTPAGDAGIMGMTGSSTFRSWGIDVGTNGSLEFSVWNSSDTEYDATAIYHVPFDGSWHHICGIFDSAGLMIYMYIDGICKNGVAFTGTLKLPAQPFYIGRDLSTYYMNGNVDEVAIFSRILSETEINDIIAYGLDGSLTPVYETYYAAIGGDGSAPKDGTAAHAWGISNLQAAATWAGARGQADTTIGPGDTLVLLSAGGQFKSTTTEVLKVLRGGVSGSPITIKGDGATVLNGEAARKAIYLSYANYVIFSNLELYNGLNDVHLLNFDTCNYCQVLNCELHTIAAGSTGAALLGGCGSGWTVAHNYFHDTQNDHGIYFFQGAGGLASNNNVVEYNIFDMIGQGTPSANGVQMNGTSQRFTGCIIRYNWFEQVRWAAINNDVCDGQQIYGNIFYHPTYDPGLKAYIGITLGDDNVGDLHVINTRIWNNVFYGYFQSMIYMTNYHDAVTPCISELKNNIFYSLGAVDGPAGADQIFIDFHVAAAQIAASDNNTFYSVASPQWQRYGQSKDTTLSAWQSGSGLDAHSISSNPLFTSPASGDFTLQKGSPAIRAGAASSPALGLCPPVRKGNFGRNGNVGLVASFANPDMGAYEDVAVLPNFATLSISGGVYPPVLDVLCLAGIIVRKSTGVVGNIQLQAAYYSGTVLAYVDVIPLTTLGTRVGLNTFWPMPLGAGAMVVRQMKATVMSNMSVVLCRR